ncbi:MAG: hypothetical protein MUF00_05965 [Gemmatimonadaceae bacterium]|jgi:hypothetical protein|nr:hypothetical protein [Gemmatimonadaceae bacterium]
MASPRRFTDDEIAHILAAASVESARATVDDPPEAATSTGLTLAEVQAVAREAGIDADAIARIAARVERGDLTPTRRRTVAGLPVALARTIDLPRPITDVEWERIVLALRETFEARGVVLREGTLREWRNGNLRAVLERTAGGDRLHVATRRGDAGVFPRLGLVALATAIVMAASLMTRGASTAALMPAAMLALAGVAALTRNVFVLPGWARRRTQQMESLGATIEQVLLRESVSR